MSRVLSASSPAWPSTVGAGARVERVVARPPKNVSDSSPPLNRSLPSPPSTVSGDQRADTRSDVQRVVAAERVELEHLGGGDVSPNGALTRS